MRYKNAIMISIVFIFIATCASVVRVSDIKQRPREYHDKHITISGTVDDVITLPILGVGVYQIDDGSGQIWVKPSGDVPYKGDRVRVGGTIKVGIEISGKTFGLLLIEDSPQEKNSN